DWSPPRRTPPAPDCQGPQLHRLVVDCEGGAQDGGGGVGRVFVGADGFYDGLRARFIVAVQYMRQGILPGRWRCGMQDIAAGLDDVMHRGRPDLPLLVTPGAGQPSKVVTQGFVVGRCHDLAPFTARPRARRAPPRLRAHWPVLPRATCAA